MRNEGKRLMRQERMEDDKTKKNKEKKKKKKTTTKKTKKEKKKEDDEDRQTNKVTNKRNEKCVSVRFRPCRKDCVRALARARIDGPEKDISI